MDDVVVVEPPVTLPGCDASVKNYCSCVQALEAGTTLKCDDFERGAAIYAGWTATAVPPPPGCSYDASALGSTSPFRALGTAVTATNDAGCAVVSQSYAAMDARFVFETDARISDDVLDNGRVGLFEVRRGATSILVRVTGNNALRLESEVGPGTSGVGCGTFAPRTFAHLRLDVVETVSEAGAARATLRREGIVVCELAVGVAGQASYQAFIGARQPRGLPSPFEVTHDNVWIRREP